MTRIQIRRDSSSNWTTKSPVLADGELGLEKDSRRLKVGDGSAQWGNLAYFGGDPPVTVAGSSLTANITHFGHITILSNAGLVTTTLPTDSTDDLFDGYWATYYAAGAGGLTLTTSGLSLVGSSPLVGVAQNQALFVQKVSSNTWLVLGGTV